MNVLFQLDKIKELLAQGKEETLDLNNFMRLCNRCFEECTDCLQSGQTLDKERMLQTLLMMQQMLEKDVEFLGQETGKTLDQMLAYVENPENFPQEAWGLMQKTWRHISAIKIKKRGGPTRPRFGTDKLS